MNSSRFLLIISALLSVFTAIADDSNLYNERWRPQYHFTPAHRWIGDPCGLVHFNGTFHAYSWGAAESTDLIHWTEINNNAINGIPKGIAPFTGSVVVDRDNSAGYGENAFIAAFTSFDENSKKQSQSIAFSHDNGRTFQYFDRNPVIDIWSTEFRDPTVIWDDHTRRWIMLVAKALEKKVAFYASYDLKNWQWLSEFGPAGDSEKSWECPDMFQLPVEGSDKSKWVLLVSVNWAREQYFVGEFDGEKFIPDNPDQAPLYVDHGLDFYASRTFQDFDHTLPAVYSIGWVSTWDYAQHVPTDYGKGLWSIPRELSLTNTPQGMRMVQRPAKALDSIRGNGKTLDTKLKSGLTPIPGVDALNNQYELDVTFTLNGDDIAGVELCAGDNQHITLQYDAVTSTLILNRAKATDRLIPKFERIAHAHLDTVGDTVTFNIFVDKSVIEIFANDGQCVMTALMFPSDNATRASFFSLRPGTRVSATLYPMESIWK